MQHVIAQRRRDLGGFEVGRVLPFGAKRTVGPFVFFDHMGPVDFAPGLPRSVDVRPHPHIGLATVTYLFAGEIMHRDSLATQQPIVAGEVNWMTAGRGITHSERFERARREGGALHGIQAWVGLPRELEECEPAFAHHEGDDLPTGEERGARWRVLAGELRGQRARVATASPTLYVHYELDASTRIEVPADAAERAVYVATGSVRIGNTRVDAGHMAVLSPGEPVVVVAATNTTAMLLGGEPIGPRHIEWNFVSSSRERIEQAKSDWRAGRFKLPDFDNRESIPLPEPPPPANPMS
ncbi:MAG TPA: pirin family protein [Xanthomonadales bacterium]|nr:pirin family protein [Xanthomonadales bacterium]